MSSGFEMSAYVYSILGRTPLGLNVIGIAVIAISAVVLLLNKIKLNSKALYFISIGGLIIGIAILIVSNMFGGGTGNGNGEGAPVVQATASSSSSAVSTAEPTNTPAPKASVTPEEKEIVIEINVDRIFVNGKECFDSESILNELDNVYTDEYTICVVDNSADHKAYTLVTGTLNDNGYKYVEK